MFNYKMKKLIPGGKYKTRPSASYFLNELNVPIGFEVIYRKKKGGPMVKHSLQMKKGKGGKTVPYWKPVSTSSSASKSIRRSIRRRSKRSIRRRSGRRSTRRSKRSSRKRSGRRSIRRRSSRKSLQKGG